MRCVLPLAALRAYRPIQNVVESDTLEADTRNLEGASSIQLCCLVQVLRGGILPARDRFFDQQLRGLNSIDFVSWEPILREFEKATSVDRASHSFVLRSSSRNALYIPA